MEPLKALRCRLRLFRVLSNIDNHGNSPDLGDLNGRVRLQLGLADGKQASLSCARMSENTRVYIAHNHPIAGPRDETKRNDFVYASFTPDKNCPFLVSGA